MKRLFPTTRVLRGEASAVSSTHTNESSRAWRSVFVGLPVTRLEGTGDQIEDRRKRRRRGERKREVERTKTITKSSPARWVRLAALEGDPQAPITTDYTHTPPPPNRTSCLCFGLLCPSPNPLHSTQARVSQHYREASGSRQHSIGLSGPQSRSRGTVCH